MNRMVALFEATIFFKGVPIPKLNFFILTQEMPLGILIQN
jgi:hypothetical protein